jgi:hypothetical protein
MKRILSALLGLGLVISAYAQKPPPGVTPPPGAIDPATGLPTAVRPNEPRFDIEFPGGGSEDLVAVIEKASKSRQNIVIHPECRGAEIPQFRLQDVSVSQIFTTLNSLEEPEFNRGVWRPVPVDGGEIWTLTKYNKNIYTGFGAMPAQPQRPRIVKVFNLTHYLEAFKVEDITTAVEGAWNLLGNDGSGAPPNIKYHKDTKLLIVVGTDTEMNVVSDVLQQLSQGAGANSRRAERPSSEKPAPPSEKPSESKTDKKL